MNIFFIIVLVAIANMATGFALGKIHERSKWNILIREGIIPKPMKELNKGYLKTLKKAGLENK